MACEGIDYFPLRCVLDEKFELLEAEYGIKGFAIVVKLFQRIYREHGYYCEWNDDIALLFARQCCLSDNGVNGNCAVLGAAGKPTVPGKAKNLINCIVAASIRRGIFDRRLYEDCSILTSRGIQRNFLNIVRNRKRVEVIKEYLLLSDAEIKGNVVITGGSYVRDGGSYVRFEQSKVKESKEKDIKTMCMADATALFEQLWALYPCKKGKGKVSDTQKKKLLKVGYEEMARAVERYKKYVDGIDYLHYQNGSTFFNSGYVDYLDGNYSPDKKPVRQQGQFHQYMQQDYNFEQLEKEILSN